VDQHELPSDLSCVGDNGGLAVSGLIKVGQTHIPGEVEGEAGREGEREGGREGGGEVWRDQKGGRRSAWGFGVG
jgi:hypothetical protein